MTPHDYDFLRKSLKERSGLVLSADKQYLVESRLLPVARKVGVATLGELVGMLRAADDAALMTTVVEAMTTNEIVLLPRQGAVRAFPRDDHAGADRGAAPARAIRIWCAAASTGQEPYSLAMCLKEIERELFGWRIEIVATDLSGEVLEKARPASTASSKCSAACRLQLLVKHFTRSGEFWQIAPELRAMVRYRQLNLLADFSQLGTFDLVFCRNVLIYFDAETKTDVLNRIARVTAADGYLVLGAAETVVGLTDRFKMVADRRGLYAPNTDPPRPSILDGVKSAPRLVAIQGGR